MAGVIIPILMPIAVIIQGHALSFGTLEQFSRPEVSEEEKAVRQIWQSFFKTIAIPERKNPRLQKSNMPAKYWKYLTEKPGE
jgi:probable DNA metabolism protein